MKMWILRCRSGLRKLVIIGINKCTANSRLLTLNLENPGYDLSDFGHMWMGHKVLKDTVFRTLSLPPLNWLWQIIVLVDSAKTDAYIQGTRNPSTSNTIVLKNVVPILTLIFIGFWRKSLTASKSSRLVSAVQLSSISEAQTPFSDLEEIQYYFNLRFQNFWV